MNNKFIICFYIVMTKKTNNLFKPSLLADALLSEFAKERGYDGTIMRKNEGAKKAKCEGAKGRRHEKKTCTAIPS